MASKRSVGRVGCVGRAGIPSTKRMAAMSIEEFSAWMEDYEQKNDDDLEATLQEVEKTDKKLADRVRRNLAKIA